MKPWPEAAAGLSFARAMVIDPIGATVPPGKDIRPVVLAGDLSQIAGKTCEEAIALASASSTGGGGASPAPIVAAALPVLPAPVFDSKKSILFAPIGCLGGAGHDGPGAEVACGAGYSPSTPTASLVVVGMSRVVDPGHLSLQVVNASTALEPSDVRLATGLNTGAEWPVALSVETGEIVPSPPFAMVASKDLGPLDKAAVKTYAQGQMSATSQTQLSEAAAHGTASMAELADGAGFVLIGVGAYPGAAAGAFWHEFTFTLIKADP